MRADAAKNRHQLLIAADAAVREEGVDVSMRGLARRADVGLATLLRHFPSRDALLEALLHTSFEDLTSAARELQTSDAPATALLTWTRDCTAWTTTYRGVTELMAAAIEHPESALHASCVALREAGTRLLVRAQDAGEARDDVDGDDLFALISMLAWLGDQPTLAPRAERIFGLLADGLLPMPSQPSRS